MTLTLAKSVAKHVLGRLTQASDIKGYLEGPAPRRLNLGCGFNILDGWLNVDLTGGRGGTVFMDALKRFPIPANSFDAVLCEHMIEHIPRAAGSFMLAEAFRVLKPGAWIRIATPDITSMARLCIEPLTPETERYIAFIAKIHGREAITRAETVNYMFREYGHQFIYSPADLSTILSDAGFVDLVETRAGQPRQEIFVGAEGHSNWAGAENNAIEAFALEARKPL